MFSAGTAPHSLAASVCGCERGSEEARVSGSARGPSTEAVWAPTSTDGRTGFIASLVQAETRIIARNMAPGPAAACALHAVIAGMQAATAFRIRGSIARLPVIGTDDSA